MMVWLTYLRGTIDSFTLVAGRRPGMAARLCRVVNEITCFSCFPVRRGNLVSRATEADAADRAPSGAVRLGVACSRFALLGPA
jgi:hypothetical protein